MVGKGRTTIYNINLTPRHVLYDEHDDVCEYG